MGAGGFMSTKAEVDYARGERKREEWECENFKEGEIEEMVELYVAKGYKRETAERIVEILSRDNKVFVDTMLVEELEIPLEQAEQSPLKNLLVNFVSFMIFGTVPILPFIVYIIGRAVSCSGAGCAGSPWNNTFIPLYISIALTVLGVALLATIKVCLALQKKKKKKES
jgi:VIT1/CCC1 family predicted Fe2+/Mn2+ transporter